MFFRAIVASIAILLLGAGAGYGDLVIDIGDLELVPGGTGYLDVSVSGAGGGQTLNAYAFEYRITKTSGVGRLEFVSPQPSYLTDSDYVFFGNSFDYENGQSVGDRRLERRHGFRCQAVRPAPGDRKHRTPSPNRRHVLDLADFQWDGFLGHRRLGQLVV